MSHRNAAAIESMATAAAAKHVDVSSGRIRHLDLAQMLMAAMPESCGGVAKRAALKKDIVLFLAAAHPCVAEDDAAYWSDTCSSLFSLPAILERFLGLTFSQSDMQALVERLVSDFSIAQASKKRQLVEHGGNKAVVPLVQLDEHGEIREKYSSCSAGELLQIVVSKDVEIANVKKELHLAKKSRTHFEARCAKLSATVAELKKDNEDLVALVNYRPGRNVSTAGGYNLAISRNRGHLGAGLAMVLMAGAEHQGGLKATSKQTVIINEHRVAVGILLRSRRYYEAALSIDAAGRLQDDFTFEVHCFKGDGTKQDMVDKHKLHVSLLGSLLMTKADVDRACGASGSLALDSLEVPSQVVACDLQIQRLGTAAETYDFVKAEMASAGCPHFASRALDSSSHPARVSVYNFGFDHGPDNFGMLPRIRKELNDAPNVMYCVSWCLFHQMHLIAKTMLAVLDKWEHASEHPVAYFSAIATLANLWRGTGAAETIRLAADKLFGDRASLVMAKAPPRALRGRWGSVDAVESHFVKCIEFLPAVVEDVYGSGKPRRAGSDDPDDEYQAQQTKWKSNVRQILKSKLFIAMILISFHAKQLLTKMMYWGQKAVRQTNEAMKDARADGVTYLGHTPLFTFYTSKSRSWFGDLAANLSDESMADKNKWGPALALASNDDERQALRLLIIKLTLVLGAHWRIRYVNVATDWPFRLFELLESEPDSDCPKRRDTAKAWLSAHRCCLCKPFSDVAWKTRELFAADVEMVANSGRCPARLYSFLVAWRAQCPFDTQEVEGMNNILQEMSKRAGHLHLGLASARMTIKKSDPIDAASCCLDHERILHDMSTERHATKFLVVPSLPPPECPSAEQCRHQEGAAFVYAKGFMSAARGRLRHVGGVGVVWVFGQYRAGQPCRAFVEACVYLYQVHLAVGTLAADGKSFALSCPLDFTTVQDEIAAALRGRTAASISLSSFEVTWVTLKAADVGRRTGHRIKWKQWRKKSGAKPRRAQPVAADALLDGPVEAAGDEDLASHGREGPGDDGQLERFLADMMREEGFFTESETESVQLDEPVAEAEAPDAAQWCDAVDEYGFDNADVEGRSSVDEAQSMAAASSSSSPAAPPSSAPPSSGCDAVSPELLRAVQEKWSALRASAAEATAKQALSTRSCVYDGAISLVVLRGACTFVRWENASRSLCRPVRLDTLNRIIYNVPYMVPTMEADGCEVLVGDVGVAMRREKTNLRPTMPSWCLVLKRLREIDLLQGQATPGECCILCSARSNAGLPLTFAIDETADMCACKLCTGVLHSECADVLRKQVDVGTTFDTVSFCCPLCQATAP